MGEVGRVGDARQLRDPGDLGEEPGHRHQQQYGHEKPVVVGALARLLPVDGAPKHEHQGGDDHCEATHVAEHLQRMRLRHRREEVEPVDADEEPGGGDQEATEAEEDGDVRNRHVRLVGGTVAHPLVDALAELAMEEDVAHHRPNGLAPRHLGPVGAADGPHRATPVARRTDHAGDQRERDSDDVEELDVDEGDEGAEDDVALGQVGQGPGHGQHHEQQEDGEAEQQRQVAGLVQPLAEEAGKGMEADAVLPERRHHIGGLGLTRTVGGAELALVALPNRRVVHEALLEAPLRPHHLLAREGVVVGRYRAHHRAGAALIAGAEIAGVEPEDGALELEVRLDGDGLVHGLRFPLYSAV